VIVGNLVVKADATFGGGEFNVTGFIIFSMYYMYY
jgi:hypothetical protein